jgi:large subunit ribosomal protein L28e
MSSALTWLLTRSNTSTLVKRNGVQFNAEKGNVLNANSYKFSGLLGDSVSVDAIQGGVALTLPSKKGGKYTVQLKKINLKKVDALVSKYRPDLAQAVVARVVRIVQSQRTPKPVKAKKVRGVSKK